MKTRIIFSAILLLAMTSCDIRNSRTKPSENENSKVVANTDLKTAVRIIDTVYNFGKVKDGAKVVYNFRFENTGKNPLVISAASASCGCTVPEKPEHPIAPGDVATIKVVFDSKGRVGPVHKEVFVTSNAEPSFPPLILSGEVTAN